MTHYQIRKQWRVKLHAKRCADNDQSVERYKRDAAVLNKAMDIYKIEGKRATW
jgi:uncharacterized protein (DUF2384 family)